MLRKIILGLGWVGTALTFLAVALLWFRPEWQNVWYWCAVTGFVCVSLYLLAHWREASRVFRHRQTRYGSMAALSIAAVLGIFISINYIASRQNLRWDLTAARQFTLSDQTIRILEALDAPLSILVFGRDDDFDRFRNRLVEYEEVSPEVSVRYIDIDKEPIVPRQYQILSYGTVVFEYRDRIERVTADTEQELTNAMIRAIEGESRTVYFLEGHGEKNIASAERDGYNAVVSALEGDNFTVETLVLAQREGVPDDATVIVVAGPSNDLLTSEIDALERYLSRGGKAFFLVDPQKTIDALPLANLEQLLAGWAVELSNDVVVDVSGMGQLIGTDASVPVAASYPPHAITERFNFLTAFPLARSLAATTGGVNGRMAQPLVETSADSWAESNIDLLTSSGEVELDEAQGDVAGPVVIGLAVTAPVDTTPEPVDPEVDISKTATETRVAVMGDSDFASNFALGIQGNRDLFLNTVNWLAQQENLVAIRARQPEDRRITLTANQQRRIFWLSLVFLPGLVLGTGIYSWWQRRS